MKRGPRKKRGSVTIKVNPMKERQRASAFDAGWTACEQRKDRSDNPYSSSHELHGSWNDGFETSSC